MFKLKSLRCVGFKRLNIPKPIEFSDGQVLIYGRNESGKSTIMEAIHYGLYGQGLRPHRRASSDDLINYHLSQAVVELKFTIDENLYTVRRIIRRKGTNRHELVIQRPDETKQLASGARQVNQLIEQALHGIDSDALLNSCLVEQKELGKLESASRSERIHAMTSLLNLEAFVNGQQDLKKEMSMLDRTNLETTAKLEKAEYATKLYDEASTKQKQAKARIKKIEQEMSDLKKRIDELDKRLAAIEKIKKLDNELNELTTHLTGQRRELESWLENALKEAERGKERLDEAVKNLEEAKTAQAQVTCLDIQIQEMKPTKEAQILLPQIEKFSQQLAEAGSEATRLEEYEKELKDRLDALKDADKQLNQLENEETSFRETKASLSRKRSAGLVIAILGLIVSAAIMVTPLFVALGLPLCLIGLLYAWRNSPTALDLQLNSIRKKRERWLGEKARIDDYKSQFEMTQQALKKQNNAVTKTTQKLRQSLSQLPSKPREYHTFFRLNDQSPLKSLPPLRDAIQKDMQTLTKLTTEHEATGKIAAQLGEHQKAHQEETTKLNKALSNIEAIKKVKHTILEQEKISPNKEEQQEHRNVDQKMAEYSEPEPELNTLKESIITLQRELREKFIARTEIHDKLNVDLTEEVKLKQEKDQLKEKNGSLETEQKEREDDVQETETTMEDNEELKKECPKLREQDQKEVFEIESMRRGIKLLEITRDGIVAGVKGRIETHMMRFLPSLTAHRYSMAQIDEKEYRIEIYDREARRWRGKGVFSGATQDQFSLALRLAFAISTIPSSRGARPGFIFLDEPLSGFDSQRRDGLLTLLMGDLSKYFNQIIVISHLEELKDEFLEQIQLEAGEVVV